MKGTFSKWSKGNVWVFFFHFTVWCHVSSHTACLRFLSLVGGQPCCAELASNLLHGSAWRAGGSLPLGIHTQDRLKGENSFLGEHLFCHCLDLDKCQKLLFPNALLKKKRSLVASPMVGLTAVYQHEFSDPLTKFSSILTAVLISIVSVFCFLYPVAYCHHKA